MKIIIEIKEDELNKNVAPAIQIEDNKNENSAGQDIIDEIMKVMHYSQNKSEWFYIKDMDIKYIINVIHNMTELYNTECLLYNDEFLSLILNLANKIKEQIYLENTPL